MHDDDDAAADDDDDSSSSSYHCYYYIAPLLGSRFSRAFCLTLALPVSRKGCSCADLSVAIVCIYV